MRLAALLAFALALPSSPTVDAAEPATVQADPQLKQRFDALGYHYEIDEDGDYKLVFSADDDDKRSQIVWVRSPVEEFGAHRVREIWSPAYRSPTADFPARVANRLLEASQDSKLGGWVKQGDIAVFVVKIDAGASADELSDAITAAMLSADQMEAELTPGKDDF